MNQQSETKQYFDSQAEQWDAQAKKIQYNTITDRNNAVIDSFRRHNEVTNFLDVGCGTGQLAIEIAGFGVNAVGLDFAPEMIEICQKNSLNANSTANFNCSSIFDYPIVPNSVDLVSAQGFIEYISEAELGKFIQILSQILKKKGAAVIGSRNRLFNLVSLNEYTDLEIKHGTINHLVTEAIAIQRSPSQELLFKALANFDFNLALPASHPNTGIDVSTRYQYTPSDLIARFQAANLFPTQIYPINFQSVPQSMLGSKDLLLAKDQLASIVSSNFKTSHQFVPFSSSFVMTFVKQ